MKPVISFLAIAMLLCAGCAKDDTFDERSDSFELQKIQKRANVPIPFKAELCAVPDMESELLSITLPNGNIIYYQSGMIISGTGTHLGRVDPEASYYEVEATVFLLETGHPYLVQSGTGKMTAANGDSFEFTWEAKISLPDRNWVGEFDIIPGTGTGKFLGCSGLFDSFGQANLEEHRNCWTAEGYILYY